MTQAKITNVVCGMLATAAVSALSYQGACEQVDMNILEPSCIIYRNEPLENTPDDNTYYRIISEETLILERVNILHEFVSNLVEKSVDMDPRFSLSVDRHFWDLV